MIKLKRSHTQKGKANNRYGSSEFSGFRVSILSDDEIGENGRCFCLTVDQTKDTIRMGIMSWYLSILLYLAVVRLYGRDEGSKTSVEGAFP